MPRAARAIGILVAVPGFIGGRLFNADLGPVGFQFIRDNERHAGAHPLAHFRAMRDDGDPAILAHRDEHQWIVDGAVLHALGAVLTGIGGFCNVQAVRDEQQPAHRLQSPQEFATTQALGGERIGDRAHVGRSA